MLNFLKINGYAAYLYLLLFSLILGLFSVSFSYHASVFEESVLYYFFSSATNNWVVKIGGVVLLMANVLLLDLLFTRQEVTEKYNHVPAFISAVFSCYVLIQNPLHPLLFAQLLVGGGLWNYFSTYKANQELSAVFDGAFMLSVASIIYPPFCLFLALFVFSLLILRSFVLREWLLSLLGIIIPYLLYTAFLFLFGKKLQPIYKNVTISFHHFLIPSYINGSLTIYATVSLLVLATVIFFLLKPISNNVKTRKTLSIFVWMFILSVISWFSTDNGSVFIMWLSIIPLSLFIGSYLGNTKSRTFAEILLWIFLAAFVTSILQQANLI
jgi:hypothetical protein